MSYPRKRHASMMESQKKAAEAEAAESMLAAATSAHRTATAAPAAAISVAATEAPKAARAQVSASIHMDDFNDSSDDDSDAGGIAFLQAGSVGGKKSKTVPKPATAAVSTAVAGVGSSSSTAAAAAAVMSLQRMHWTKEMDALLLHIVPIYDAKDWVSIAKHMGGEVTNEQCRNRWCCKVDPSLNACKMGAWEPEEENQLRELIQQFTNHPEQDKRGRRRYRDSVHWGAVAKELNRSQKDCRSKYTTLQRSVVIQDMKKGPFTPEEDAVVMQRVAEWGDKGQGIWKALEQELGRPSNNIGNRYRKLVKTFASAGADGAAAASAQDATGAGDYLEVDSERKLATALAPMVGEGASTDMSDAVVREATLAAAVLAGKKRGRPRSNPIPLMLDENGSFDAASIKAYGARTNSVGSKRSRADELADVFTAASESASTAAAASSSSASVPVQAAAPAPAPAPGMPINISAELAAGRTKIGRSSFWNEEKDALLVEAVAQFGKDWNRICAHVGEGANSDRCWQRWNRYLKPDAMVCKTEPWTTEELIKLEEMVLTHINNPNKRRAGRSTSKTTIDWTSISQLMGRPYMDCKGKWKKIKAFNMKKGPFTEEEDALILQQVAELGIRLDGAGAGAGAGPGGDAAAEGAAGTGAGGAQEGAVAFPSGFWEGLSAALNRPPEILRARVRNMRNRGVGLV